MSYNKKNKNKYVSYISLVCILFCVSCKEQKQKIQMPPPVIGAYEVHVKDVPFVIESPGRISGSLEVQVRAQANGILKKRFYKEGEFVKQGEQLFEIDSAPYKAIVDKAAGNVEQAKSMERRANIEYLRLQKLLKANAVSLKDYDDAVTTKERAIANVKMAEAELRTANINLGYTTVRAPIDGIVGKENYTVGNLIAAVGDANLLTSMVQTSPLHVEFSVPGNIWSRMNKRVVGENMHLLKPSDYVVEVSRDGILYPKQGKIIFIDNREDDFTSSVILKAEITADKNQKFLLPGQFVRVTITSAIYSSVIVVPISAIISTEKGMIVYVVNDKGVVEAKAVNAELKGNEALVFSGLSNGEHVVIEGIIKVRPGQKAKVIMKNAQPTLYSQAR